MTPGSCPSDTSAHPRSHGENHSKGGKARTVPGSSPLTRGKRVFGGERQGCVRFIPAHAGKTNSAGLYPISLPAHPRSRGENLGNTLWSAGKSGSSPLTRGKPDALPHAGGCERLIPAHAGKTGPQADRPDRLGAHPRSRGENFGVEEDSGLIDGSSPLTRGKPDAIRQDRHHHRLIPAHAGKTPPPATKRPPSTAHPRSRGENKTPFVSHVHTNGSSPLTRGKLIAGDRCRVRVRLIPAHAGKTSAQKPKSQRARAHPRSRGENPLTAAASAAADGSSPLTRGKLRPPARHGP